MPASDDGLFETRTERQLLQNPAGRRPAPATRKGLFARLLENGIAVLRPRPLPAKSGPVELGENGQVQMPLLETPQHHPRRLTLCEPGKPDSAFWINLVIGGSGVEPPPISTREGALVSKAFGELPNALADLYAIRDFFRPTRIGDPFVATDGSLMRSPGYFSHTLWLADPDEAAINRAIDSMGHWLAVNSDDPEFKNFQINFFFSGHGGRSDDPGSSYLHVKGGVGRTAGAASRALERAHCMSRHLLLLLE